MVATKTIGDLFEEFLADQKARLSPKTHARYQGIIQIYQSYLENYWPGHEGESSRVNKAGGTYCGTFGAKEITGGFSMFLGYFMPRKVIAGNDTMKAAGTVTKKLAKWLAEKGYATDTEDAEEVAKQSVRDLPASQKVLRLLDAHVGEKCADRYSQRIEDHFWIAQIEPGKLWLYPMTARGGRVGAIPVPEQVTRLCKEDWDIGGVVAKTKQGWRLVEVWNVSP